MIDLLLAALTVYRLATDLAWEDGPFDLFARLRGAVMSRAGANSWLSSGVNCPICLSFWLSLPAAYLWGALAWLGIAGAVALAVRLRP
jgi:hypothetical protein